jgi:16S rRNA (adenine1518-N6/adenine1519-N6)-dimethyltransferase
MGTCTTEQIEAAGLRADARAEQVEVEGFVRLANGAGNRE